MPELSVARSELVLGRSAPAQTARAEALATAWLAGAPGRRVVYITTAQVWDAQLMALADPARHAAQHAVSVEEPTELAHALGAHSRADTLIVVDCLTLWLTASLMQALTPDASDAYMAAPAPPAAPSLADAVKACAGPLVLIAHGLQPASLPARADLASFLDTLGALNQQAAAACERVTLATDAGALTLKSPG